MESIEAHCLEREKGEPDTYFAEYGEWSVHELMLKDRVRTETYRRAIEMNAVLFEDKVVMDVGSGTGILSLFCARAGAKRVLAVEGSAIAGLCKEIVTKNRFDSVVQVIHKKVEEIDDMDDLEVDIIVSEWMGYYLVHESMLNTVIYARDKWLKHDGILFPSSASLYFAPVSMDSYYKENSSQWKDFYGFDFSPVTDFTQERIMSKPIVTQVSSDQLLSAEKLLGEFAMGEVSLEDVGSILNSLEFEICKESNLHGFAAWFVCHFPSPGADTVSLSTAPGRPATHWKQTVFMLPESTSVCADEVVSCQISMTQNERDHRRYDVNVFANLYSSVYVYRNLYKSFEYYWNSVDEETENFAEKEP